MSLSLLGRTAASTPVENDEKLQKLWAASEMWPVTMEQEPIIIGSEHKSSYSNFCPEVSYDRFGWFASSLHPHLDEIDTDISHRQLAAEDASQDDWGWGWASVFPMHYTECPLYSMLDYRTTNADKSRVEKTIQHLKNRPWISRVVIAGIVIVGLGAASKGIEEAVSVLWKFAGFILAIANKLLTYARS